jgi:hypothetical protein
VALFGIRSFDQAESQHSIATLVLLSADRSSVRALSPGDHSTATALF